METPCYLHTYDTLTKQLRGIAEVILGWDHLDTSLALQGRHERQDRQDRGLAWILRNRTGRRQAMTAPHVTTVGVLPRWQPCMIAWLVDILIGQEGAY